MHRYHTCNFRFHLLGQKIVSAYNIAAVCCNSHVQENIRSSNRFASIQGKTISWLSEFRVSFWHFEVTWSSVKSLSDLYKQRRALLPSPVFFVSGLQWDAQCLWFDIAAHFLGIFTVCKFAFLSSVFLWIQCLLSWNLVLFRNNRVATLPIALYFSWWYSAPLTEDLDSYFNQFAIALQQSLEAIITRWLYFF